MTQGWGLTRRRELSPSPSLPHAAAEAPLGGPIRQPAVSSRRLMIGAVWLLELVVLFVLAEGLSVFFLSPGHRFHYPQKLVQPSARRIYDNQPNQRAFTIDQPYVTNSMGFRDEREVPVVKGGELRILSLGDSVAEGLGVAAEDTYARQLEASLRGRGGEVRVINAAVGSYSTWQEVDLLEAKGPAVQPDIVLLAFFWNDLYVKPATVTPLSMSEAGERRDAGRQYVRWLKRSRILSFLRERLEILGLTLFPSFDWAHQETIYEGRTNPYLDRAWGDVAASIEDFMSLADAQRFTPILVIFPLPGQVRRPDAPDHMQRRLEAICRDVGLPTLDLLPTLREAVRAKADLYIPWDNTHLTARGHREVAEALERYLLDRRLVSPPSGDQRRRGEQPSMRVSLHRRAHRPPPVRSSGR